MKWQRWLPITDLQFLCPVLLTAIYLPKIKAGLRMGLEGLGLQGPLSLWQGRGIKDCSGMQGRFLNVAMSIEAEMHITRHSLSQRKNNWYSLFRNGHRLKPVEITDPDGSTSQESALQCQGNKHFHPFLGYVASYRRKTIRKPGKQENSSTTILPPPARSDVLPTVPPGLKTQLTQIQSIG